MAQEQAPNFKLIASIATSAILFSVSIPVTILFYLSSTGRQLDKVSVILPANLVHALNRWIEGIFTEGTSTENAIVVVGFLILGAFIGQTTVNQFQEGIFPVALILGLVLYSIDQRGKKKKRLIAMLRHDERIPLKIASKRLDLSTKNLIKMVFDLSSEGHPIAVDTESKYVYRTKDLSENTETVSTQVQESGQRMVGEICAYCGEANPIVGAKFCIKCGASMVPAK